MTVLRSTQVNIQFDAVRRTLHAWQELLGISAVSCLLPPHPFVKSKIKGEQTGVTQMIKETERKSRRQLRYERRRRKREKWREDLKDCDNFKKVFSYKNLYRAYKKCRKHVSWKCSVQKFIANAPLLVYRIYKSLESGSFRSSGFYEFDLYERGKARHIRSVVMKERVVQRCLCDNALVPMLTRSFIYDNGACMKGKGYSFQTRRINRHLNRHIRKHGTNGYVLLYDFSKYFDRISHGLVKGIVYKTFRDKKIIGLTFHFINAFGDVGLGLGSQISQVLALSSANRLDHIVKEELRMKEYGRYNDDGYIFSESKERLFQCLDRIKEVCAELEITLNKKKTQIVKLTRGFSWLKVHHVIPETGKNVKKIYKNSVVKQRQKFKKFHRRVKDGLMLMSDVKAAKASWLGYASNFDSWHTQRNMKLYYIRLFGTA